MASIAQALRLCQRADGTVGLTAIALVECNEYVRQKRIKPAT